MTTRRSRYLELFLDEARAHVGGALDLAVTLHGSLDDAVAHELALHAHSLKGLGSTLGIDALARLAHRAESLLEQVRTGVAGTETTDRLLGILHSIEKLVDSVEPDEGGPALEAAADRLEFSVLEPRLRSAAQAVAHERGKSIELELCGADAEVERAALSAIAVPLIHLLRNAVDHGIESSDERRAALKPDVGRIRIAVEPREDRVVFMVEDDGRGIDPEVVRRRAVAQGLLTAAEARTLDADEARMIVTFPGFTTRARPDELSGRGMGLDAVRTDVESVGGHVILSSVPGRGTRVELHLPTVRQEAEDSWPSVL